MRNARANRTDSSKIPDGKLVLNVRCSAAAARFAALIGDTPRIDQAGRVVVTDEQGRELARLGLPSLSSS